MTLKKFNYEQYDRFDSLMDAKDFNCSIEIEFDDDSYVNFKYAKEPMIRNGYFIVFTEHCSWHRFIFVTIREYRIFTPSKNGGKWSKWKRGGCNE